MSAIPITGTPSSWRAPFTRAEIVFNQGPSTASAGARSAMYIGPKTTAGSATVNTVYAIGNDQDAITYFGVGSPLHRMIRAHLRANSTGKVFAACYAASSGGSPVAATGTITVTITTITASGLLSFAVGAEEMSVGFKTTDTATTIGAAITDAVNAKVHLPCTAGNSSGVVTLTAKIAGASQGDGTVGVIRFRASVDPGKGVAVATSGAALGISTGVAGADGSTTEVANLTTLLATLTADRKYYMGFSVWSAAALAVIKTHISTKSQPNPGLRCVAVTGYTHTLAAAQTLAIAVNYERQQVVWQKNSDHDTASLTGQIIGIRQKQEQLDSAFNFDYYKQPDWFIKPSYAQTDWPTEDDVNDAVTDGITPIASNQYGSYLVMSTSTRSKDSAGTIDDFRSTETHRVSVMDEFTDTWMLRHDQMYGRQGFKLKDDQRKPDGSINFNQKQIPRVLTPSIYGLPKQLIREFENSGKIQDANAWIATLRVMVDPNNSSRLECGVAGRTIDLLHQTTIRVAETTPG